MSKDSTLCPGGHVGGREREREGCSGPEEEKKGKEKKRKEKKRIPMNERGKDGCCHTGPRNGCAPIENARENA